MFRRIAKLIDGEADGDAEQMDGMVVTDDSAWIDGEKLVRRSDTLRLASITLILGFVLGQVL